MSTAVVPFFKITRGSTYVARCNHCGAVITFSYLATTRDQRMVALANHLAAEHQSGPLAVSV